MPYLVVGLVTGAIYGLAGVGLVLTYKTSGIFNFAHGALAALGAFVFYWLHVDHGLHWAVAGAITVLGFGTVVGLLMERLARHVARMTTVYKITSTVGLVLIVQGLTSLKYTPGTATVPNFLPQQAAFHPAGITVSWSDVIVTLTGIAIVVILYSFFRLSRMGVTMRAVVDDPELLDLAGTNPVSVRRWAWIIGSTLATLSGILISMGSNLDAVALTFLVVQAFGAAAIGAFSSLPLTYVGGTAVGILSALSTKQWGTSKYLGGLPGAIPVVVLFLVLLVIPRRKLVTPGSAVVRPRPPWLAPIRVRLAAGVVAIVVLALVPQWAGSKLDSYGGALAYVIIFLSLGLVVKTSGQVSLCHLAFAAVGASSFSQFTTDHGLPWLVALFLAGLVAVPVGAIVSIPAVRLSGLYLALATLGFGIAMERLFYPLGIMFSTSINGRPIPRPSWGGSDHGYYYVVLAFAVLTTAVMVAIHQGRLGRVLRGMADSPLALSTLGLSVNTTRVIVFCISAFFAAIAGALYGAQFHFTAARDFAPFSSLVVLALLAINPLAEPWFAIAGAAALKIVPTFFNDTNNHITLWLNVLFGVFAIVVSVQGGPQPAPAALRRLFTRFGDEGRRGTTDAAEVTAAAETQPPVIRHAGDGLAVTDLSVRYGGLVAVSDLDMSAPLGRITGLIGPNGAGKTTSLNVCSGLLRPTHGTVTFDGHDVTHLDAAGRGRRGVGRTFQRMELFDSLSVAANVALGCEAAMAGSLPHRQLAATRGERRQILASAHAAIDVCGLGPLAGKEAGSLSTGERRLVEVARCLAGDFKLLVLDEPSSGLDRAETQHLGEILTTVTEERGVGILLVEHDMALVMDVCAYIYVLDFGKLIFEGRPTEVAASPTVQAAYLGSQAVGAAAEQPE